MARSGRMAIVNDELINDFIKDDNYDIWPDGRIWTRLTLRGKRTEDTWRLLAIDPSSNGYYRVRYKSFRLSVQRIIYRKFVGRLADDLVVHHKDDDYTNNHFENLELVTQKTNCKYRHKK